MHTYMFIVQCSSSLLFQLEAFVAENSCDLESALVVRQTLERVENNVRWMEDQYPAVVASIREANRRADVERS